MNTIKERIEILETRIKELEELVYEIEFKFNKHIINPSNFEGPMAW